MELLTEQKEVPGGRFQQPICSVPDAMFQVRHTKVSRNHPRHHAVFFRFASFFFADCGTLSRERDPSLSLLSRLLAVPESLSGPVPEIAQNGIEVRGAHSRLDGKPEVLACTLRSLCFPCDNAMLDS